MAQMLATKQRPIGPPHVHSSPQRGNMRGDLGGDAFASAKEEAKHAKCLLLVVRATCLGLPWSEIESRTP